MEAVIGRYERELFRNLDDWRTAVVGIFGLELNDNLKTLDFMSIGQHHPAIQQALRARLHDYMATEWHSIDDAPKRGDMVIAEGTAFWYRHDAGTDGCTPDIMIDTDQLIGTITDCTVGAYIDASCLDPNAHVRSYSDYEHSLGLQLVLSEASVVHTDRTVERIDADMVLLPLHYDTLHLMAFASD